MACMKQTPRTPALERPLAAMGIDVQERRVPLKPATRRYQKEESNLANIYCIKHLNGNQLLVELKSCIDTIGDYWLYVKYVGINSLPKV